MQLTKRSGSHVPSALLSQVVEIYETTVKPTPPPTDDSALKQTDDSTPDKKEGSDEEKLESPEGSEAATTPTTTPSGPYVPSPVRRRASTLLIYGLNRAVNNTHLEQFLKDFQVLDTLSLH